VLAADWSGWLRERLQKSAIWPIVPLGQRGLKMAVDGTAFTTQTEESAPERASRVSQLNQLVKEGNYTVHSRRLAMALLDWDPRRSGTRQDLEVTDRRRSYMREYMRRRRAAQASATTNAQ
jgi:hypothetical protein